MNNTEKRISDFDLQLIEVMKTNWSEFVELIGEEELMSAKIIILKERGKTCKQISIRLGITERIASYRSVSRKNRMVKKGNKRLTDLEQEIRQLAINEYSEFRRIFGERELKSAKILMLHKLKYENSQISDLLDCSIRRVRYVVQVWSNKFG